MVNLGTTFETLKTAEFFQISSDACVFSLLWSIYIEERTSSFIESMIKRKSVNIGNLELFLYLMSDKIILWKVVFPVHKRIGESKVHKKKQGAIILKESLRCLLLLNHSTIIFHPITRLRSWKETQIRMISFYHLRLTDKSDKWSTLPQFKSNVRQYLRKSLAIMK